LDCDSNRIAQSFRRFDAPTVDCARRIETSVDGFAVKKDSAGAALTLAATILHPAQIQT
jgi:hypothetical protein